MNRRIVMGIDGGGTQTRTVLADGTGRVLGRGTSGPGNYHNVGVQAVQANIDEALRQAWDQAGLERRSADAAFLGLGSIVSREDRNVIRSIVDDLDMAPNEYVGVDHDLRVALAGGLVGQPGIVVIAGTGSSCYGRTADGHSWRAGGWGPVLDDRGSSYDLGRRAMIAAVRDFDRRGEPTVLRERVLDVLCLDDIQKIMFKVDGQRLSRKEVAELARVVTFAAQEGDAVAQSIISEGAEQLALMIRTVAEALFAESDGPVRVATAGGLMQAGGVIMDPLREAVARQAPSCRIVEPVLSPELGATLLAVELAVGKADAAVVERLKESAANAARSAASDLVPPPQLHL